MLIPMSKKNNVVELPRVTADTIIQFRKSPAGDLSPRFQRVVDAARKTRKAVTLQALFDSLKLETKTAFQDTAWIVRQLAREGALQLKPAADAAIKMATGGNGNGHAAAIQPVRPATGFYVTAKGLAVAFSNDAVLGRLKRVVAGKADPRLTKALMRGGLIQREKREAIRVDHNEMILTGTLDRMRQVLGGAAVRA
jgi:hypothetical protein